MILVRLVGVIAVLSTFAACGTAVSEGDDAGATLPDISPLDAGADSTDGPAADAGEGVEDAEPLDVAVDAQDDAAEDADVVDDADLVEDVTAPDADASPEDIESDPETDVESDPDAMSDASQDSDANDVDACSPADECAPGDRESRAVSGECLDYEESRECQDDCSFGPWVGDDPSVTCPASGPVPVLCDGEAFEALCDSDGNDVTWTCDGGTLRETTVFGCNVALEPGAGTRVCPGGEFVRSCQPIAGGQGRIRFECLPSDSDDGGRFRVVAEDYCTATSGAEAGQNFCPGEIILRDECSVGGARRYFVCPDDAEAGARFVSEADLSCTVEAQEWEPVHRGVDLMRWTDGGRRFRALRVDLCDASLRVAATATEERGQTTSGWGANAGMVAAINGGFFSSGYRPDACVAFGDGREWPDSGDSGARSFIAFGEGNAYFSEAPAVESPPYPAFPWMEESVCGDATLVRGGVAQTTGTTTRRARTGAGVTADGRTLFMLTVDENAATGMTVNEFAPAMAALGVDWAINLDGGGSTTMWVDGLGVVNRPTAGSQRVVANHLGVWIEGGASGYNCRE